MLSVATLPPGPCRRPERPEVTAVRAALLAADVDPAWANEVAAAFVWAADLWVDDEPPLVVCAHELLRDRARNHGLVVPGDLWTVAVAMVGAWEGVGR